MHRLSQSYRQMDRSGFAGAPGLVTVVKTSFGLGAQPQSKLYMKILVSSLVTRSPVDMCDTVIYNETRVLGFPHFLA